MGQVYRARDTHLGRDVAIKALPDSMASDAERVARFQREAQVLATLNHPNIAGIHGLQEANGAKYLVLEFVPGVTLSDYLTGTGPLALGTGNAGTRHLALGTSKAEKPVPSAQGPVPDKIPKGLPLSAALPIASQIIDALEAAHDRGIVHRDLKPANIMLSWRGAPPRFDGRHLEPTFSAADVADATVKVLDFGLARVVDADPTASASNSPTLTFAATQVGVILGTAAYMSPEQAKGRVADKRSDVWAFGCVLYEMLTGRRVFEGEDVSDTLAAVLRADPDWSVLPGDLPPGIASLLKRCLDRERKTRIPDMAVVRFLLQDATAPAATAAALSPAVSAPPARVRQWIWPAAALVAGLAAITAVAVMMSRSQPPAPSPTRFGIHTAPVQNLGATVSDRQLAISPDGKNLVYVVGGGTAGGPLVMRAMDRLEMAMIPGITGARNPFFSPDGKWLGFFSGQLELKKAPISGGAPMVLCRLDGGPLGASWAPDDTIIFGTAEPSTGLQSIPAGGGEPKKLTTPNPAEGDHVFPSVLPDGRGVLFTIVPPGGGAGSQIAVLDLRTGQHKTLIRGGTQPDYVDPGYLVYVTAGALHAVRFDLARQEVVGDPVSVVDNVGTTIIGAAQYAVSRTGTLVQVPGSVFSVVGGGSLRSLVWVNRQGREEPINAPPRPYFNLRLSPDGTRVVLDVRDQENDIWVWDLSRHTLTRLTFDQTAEIFPIWTRDSRRIVFGAVRGGVVNLFAKSADGTGTEERLTTAPHPQYPMSFSADGKQLLVNELKAGQSADVSVMPFGEKGDLVPLLHSPALERAVDISPDGKFMAYESNESDASEIYVRPFPDVNSGRWQVSTAGGSKPAWAPDGRELFFVTGDGFLAAVPVETSAGFKQGNPTKLFEVRNIATLGSARFYDVSRDAKRFVLIKEVAQSPGQQATVSTAPTFIVVLHWTEELKARLGTGR